MNVSTGWRTLAEPTYGVAEFGQALRLDAGTLLQPYDAKGVDPTNGCGVKRGPEGTSTFLFRDAEGWDEPDLAYLTASALRFESDRLFDQQRREQGFRSQAHLDAFYRYSDHCRGCEECQRPGEPMWLEGSASWQPTQRQCDEALRLLEASYSEHFEEQA